MVRATLWAVLSCAAVAACGSKDSAPAAQPGAVAGKVLEVSGGVKVGAKQLAVGDQVKSDDVVETGADGNVVIELAHNGARWELGPNQKVRPTESIAWKQERHGSAAQVDQDTSAAGRPAERSAADTSTSAKAAAPMAEAAPAPSAQAAAVAPPIPRAEPPPPPPKTAAPHAAVAATGAAGEERSRGAAPGGVIGGAGDGGGGGAKADRADRGEDLTADMFAKLSDCVPAGKKVRVTIHVANHVPAIKFAAGTNAKVEKCMTDAAKKLSIAVTTGDISLTLGR